MWQQSNESDLNFEEKFYESSGKKYRIIELIGFGKTGEVFTIEKVESCERFGAKFMND
jgi:hypothetical protein